MKLANEDEDARETITSANNLRDAMLEKYEGDEAMETLAWLVEWPAQRKISPRPGRRSQDLL